MDITQVQTLSNEAGGCVTKGIIIALIYLAIFTAIHIIVPVTIVTIVKKRNRRKNKNNGE